ncbi:hypothetical protein LSH36_43g00005 [Paralvinella palmiformis]|uniref:Uncharacterized protein n=1 Tax=Paralvinella palmiformis TaxID=53620 RepID=A0AAD9K715_9ANNE|nr:hypothetical protein LSH36_43g00005 [Paralvinella palmiformis]
MGDSTGGRYYQALLNTSTIKFTTIRQEVLREGGFLPDIKYFAKHLPEDVMKFVKAKFRFCSGCKSIMNQAIFKNNHSSDYLLNIEHIAQTMILDDSLEVVYPSHNVARSILNKTWAITMQEVIFRYYLNKQYPDLFIIFLPFSHAKVNLPLSRLPTEIQYFKALVEEYLPQKTKLFYMPAHSEHEQARKHKEWKNRLFDGMLAKEKINRMNQILYRVLENDLLNQSGRYYGFLDLFHLSKDLDSWSLDGVHLKPVWYETVMSMFWETYCNSVLMDRF